MPATKNQLRARFRTVLLTFLPVLLSFVRGKLPFANKDAGDRRTAEKLRLALESLGIVFIKVGQVLGVRADLLAPAYVEELGKLHFSVKPVAAEIVKPYLEAEFGKPLNEVLEAFDPESLATASIGQVHRARYRGNDIAIKFLKPDTARVLDTDFELIRAIAGFLRKFSRSGDWEDILAVLDRFESGFREEADFTRERQHGERIFKVLRGFDDVVVPRMIPELCTARVVAMEFIEGVRITDTAAVKRLGINPKKMLNRLVQVYAHMILGEGYYHADPHPGNFLVMDDGRIALLDFGMVQTLSEKTRVGLYGTIKAAMEGREDDVVDGFYRVGLVAPEVPRAKAKAAIRTIGDIQFAESVTKNRIDAVGKAVENSRVRFMMPEDLAYAFRLIQMLEGVASHYQPGWNVIANGGPGLEAAFEDFLAAPPPDEAERDWPKTGAASRFFGMLKVGLGFLADEIEKRFEARAAERREAEDETGPTETTESEVLAPLAVSYHEDREGYEEREGKEDEAPVAAIK